MCILLVNVNIKCVVQIRFLICFFKNIDFAYDFCHSLERFTELVP